MLGREIWCSEGIIVVLGGMGVEGGLKSVTKPRLPPLLTPPVVPAPGGTVAVAPQTPAAVGCTLQSAPATKHPLPVKKHTRTHKSSYIN